jgi:hypothetical protein
MKLAEALTLRADAQKRIKQLQSRLVDNVRVQEGEQPAEDPQELLVQFDLTIAELGDLISSINRTNVATCFDDASNLSDAITRRDMFRTRREVLANIASRAAQPIDRYSRSEIREVSTVDVRNLRQQTDDLARQHRELDTQIQALNWTTDLID